MSRRAPGPRALVERLGGHPATELGIDLAAEEAPGRWFVACCVLAERAPSDRGPAAVRALAERGLLEPGAAAAAGPAALHEALAAADHPRAEPLAHRIARACRRLEERHEGSFDALAAGCDDLEALGRAVSGLASGVGAATVLRFLGPFRERWSAAAETPLDPAARSAAAHLGWISDGDEETAAALGARLADEPDPPERADLEAALERLGRRACRRGDPSRCPLADACPLR